MFVYCWDKTLLKRCFHHGINVMRCMNYNLCHLNNRSLLHVYGKDSFKLIQGLVTNDLNTLNENSGELLYSMFLNARGRCIYDVMLYPYMENNMAGYLMECDKQLSEDLLQYIKMYKLRSKVKFDVCKDKNIFALYGSNISKNLQEIPGNDFLLFKDNRTKDFGFRLISNQNIERLSSLTESDISNEDDYKIYRYKTGISEGQDETSNCIPLEHNLALLNGISFTKGCYIGQELMAKTNFTGVIRKRITPLYFNQHDHKMQVGSTIRNEKNKRTGKVIAIKGQYGIALVRLNEFFKGSTFIAQNDQNQECEVNIIKPNWWPEEIEY